MKYPIRYRSRPDGIHAVLVDFPDYIGVGPTREDAKFEAEEKLLTALQILMDSGETIPTPSSMKKSWDTIQVPVNVQLKLLMHQRLLELGWNRTFLASQLEVERKKQRAYLSRLFNLRYQSRLDQVVTVFHALGLKVSVSITDPPDVQVRGAPHGT